MSLIYEVLLYVIMIYFMVANGTYLFLLVTSFWSVRRQYHSEPLLQSLRDRLSKLAPSVSVIAPAHNEEATIAQSVESFLSLNYPRLEVIVVNDGSTDSTLAVLMEKFRLEAIELFYDHRLSSTAIRGVYRSSNHPQLIVVDKENGGKADSINVGIGFSHSDLFCAVDSDSLLERDGLLRVVIPFIENPEETVASGGTVRPVNGSLTKNGVVVRPRLPKNPLALLQVVEYLRAFLFGRIGWNALGCTMIISGAFGLFKRSAVLEVGGYQEKTVGEDMELVMRLRAHAVENNRKANVAFVSDPICWTEVPENLAALGRQRNRWQRGLAETLMAYRKMLFKPKFGFTGLFAYPYFFLFELLGPLIEILGYLLVVVGLITGWMSKDLLILFFCVDILYGVLMSVGAVLIEESAYHKYPKLSQLGALLMVACLEHLGYRQFNLFNRLRGLWAYVRGDRSWGAMTRLGFDGSSHSQ